MKFFYRIIFFSLILSSLSCVKDLDFNQVDELELEPAVAVSLLNLDINQSEYDIFDVADSTFVNQSVVDEALLPNFRNQLLEEDLQRVEFQFEGSNTFNGEFILDLTFLDDNDNVTYVMGPIIIPANTEEYSEEKELVILSNPRIFDSTRIRGVLNFNGVLSTEDDGVLDLKSAGIFYFSIN